MKIHLEFNNMAEMYLYCKTLMNNMETQKTEPKNKVAKAGDSDDAIAWKSKYEITVANLERAYERIRMLDPKGNTMNISEKDVHSSFRENINKDISTLELPMRAFNCLLSENILTIGDLIKKSRNDLRKIPNLGKGSLKDIEEALFAKCKLYIKGATV